MSLRGIERFIKELDEKQKIKEEMKAQGLKCVIKILPPKLGIEGESTIDEKYRYTYIATLKQVFFNPWTPKIFYDEQNNLYFIIMMYATGSKRSIKYEVKNLRTGKIFHGFPEANYQNTEYYKIIPEKWYKEAEQKPEDIYEYRLNWVLYLYDEKEDYVGSVRRSSFDAYSDLASALFVKPSVHMIKAGIYLFKPSQYLIVQKYSYCYGIRKITSGEETKAFLIDGTNIQEILSEEQLLSLADVEKRLPQLLKQ